MNLTDYQMGYITEFVAGAVTWRLYYILCNIIYIMRIKKSKVGVPLEPTGCAVRFSIAN